MKSLDFTEMEKIQGGGCGATTALGAFVCAGALTLFAPLVAGCIGATLYNLANCVEY